MKALTISSVKALSGVVHVPGDKSISHRALMFSALADGICHVRGFLPGKDCLATLGCLESLGVQVDRIHETELRVHGRGMHGLCAPTDALNCVRSGTTMRLLSGLLAGQQFNSVLAAEAQLARRPMRRVIEPLTRMGAQITSAEGFAPLAISGQALTGCAHTLKIASAQVKSAILLAGMYANGKTEVTEPSHSRDHTERMLQAMQAAIEFSGCHAAMLPTQHLQAMALDVPGDFSSAAFLLVAGAVTANSAITIKNIGVNPTRRGLLDVLLQMGADCRLDNEALAGAEPVADITIKTSTLKGIEVGGDQVVAMIDEFPVFAVAAALADGQTTVRDAAELRVKETDRISTVVTELKKMGADIEETPDGFVVQGGKPLQGCALSSHGDHRLAMALAVAALAAEGDSVLDDVACTADSFPGFVALMQKLGADYA